MKNKIHSLGNVEYDANKKTLSIEGVIIEKGRDVSIDDSKRVYLGVEPPENGAYILSNTVCLRERSDAEKQRDLETIMTALESPIKRVIKNSTVWNLPYNLLTYAGNEIVNKVKYKVLEAKRDKRKRNLEKRVAGRVEDLERTSSEYESAALGYVWEVVEQVFSTNGENSELFGEASTKLFTIKEQEKMQRNIKERKELMRGIGCVEDRRYATDEIKRLYNVAKEIAIKFGFGEESYLEYLQNKVESSPLHKLQYL